MHGKPDHVLPGNKYFILQCGVTLNSHVSFIDLLEQKIRSLQKVNTVDECDFILAFCPVVSRAGTDIERAEKKLHAISATKPAVLVMLHRTFDLECVVPNSCRVVKRENTITVDCLFHEDQGLLQCRKNSDAIEHVYMQIKPKRTPMDAEDETCKENAGKLEDFKKEIAEMKLFGLPKNNEVIIATELRLVLLGGDESDKTAAKNIILGREEINQAATSTATATQQSESTQVIAGTKVLVVDTPGFFSPGNSLEALSQTVEPQAFLLVIPVKYLEDKLFRENETQMTLIKLEQIFGTECWRNTMIIFTISDELQRKKIEEFIQTRDQEVQRLLEKCENRFHCLNIKESGNGSRVSELLEKIEKMVEGKRNASEKFQIIRNIEMERHAKHARIRKIQKVLEKCEQFDKDYENDLKTLGKGGSTGSDGKTKGSNAMSTAEWRRRAMSTAEQQSRVTSTVEQQGQATSTAEQQRREMSTAEHSHRATSTDKRWLRGDNVRLAGVWNSPRGGRVGARCCRNSPPLATGRAAPPTEATSWGGAPNRNMGRARVGANKTTKKSSRSGALAGTLLRWRALGQRPPRKLHRGETPPTGT
ncbi:hypothetical protein QTP86_005768 [Hemibagrus guttatus]|nr:hypothetical protein QTP86_005768 [Hemibagrus guttatus]